MKLSSTARQVLHNLHTGKPMWTGVHTVTPGSGVPAIVTMLRKRGLIRVCAVTGRFLLTPEGEAIAKKENR